MYYRRTISHTDAAALVGRAFSLAHASYGEEAAVACAVVGSDGELIAYGAQDGAGTLPRRLASRKAYSAVLFKRDTLEVRAAVDSGAILLSTLQDDELLPIPGGVVIRDGGTLIGAIGVSGMTPDQDHSIAEGATVTS